MDDTRGSLYLSGIHAVGAVLQLVYDLNTSQTWVEKVLGEEESYRAQDADQISEVLKGWAIPSWPFVLDTNRIEHALTNAAYQRRLALFKVCIDWDKGEFRWAILEGMERETIKYGVCLHPTDKVTTGAHPENCATGDFLLIDYKVGRSLPLYATLMGGDYAAARD
jgi:hypothetical protein